jgi:ribose/xylose/arabinose/galactoside ABC-type transport system permease subunit
VLRLSRQHLPVVATLVVLVVLYTAASMRFENFATLRVFVNFLVNNAFLGIVAVGMTYVIITGGIDLSVGAVVGCTTIGTAVLIERQGLHPVIAFAIVLACGAALGAAQGWVIHRFRLQPFLVTLAGLFLCRGIGLWISSESVQADHAFFDALYDLRIPLADKVWLPLAVIVFLLVLGVSAFVLKQTRFGRTVYAIGGDEQSAHLMGLPVARTKIGVYALSGFCAALGGVVLVMYTSAGNAINGTGLELDAIATVVIGGTLLTGGYGSVVGTFLGLLIFSVMQSAITFEGTLSSWWAKIATGVLLLAFILLQRAIQRDR